MERKERKMERKERKMERKERDLYLIIHVYKCQNERERKEYMYVTCLSYDVF